MLPELGNFALVLALVLAVVQSTLPLYGAWREHPGLMATARSAAYGQFVFLLISYIILTTAFLQQDFSVAYVAQNSNTLLPVIYRISAVWGAHEGSLLLWVLILGMWTVAVAAFSRSLPDVVVARVLAVMGWVSVGFILFTALTSNPFDRLLPAPLEGRDLNPLLQDPGLIIHPPMLYAGYVGFAVAFAFAIAALLGGKLDAQWVRWSRPWTNVAWAFLTIGIGLGSWWAYYELGWGGWWFWDPVENASFMPWLAGTALIHSQAVTEKRGSFAGWTLLLAIAAFSLSLLGAFLVRSGVLTSVHAFASDPERGVFILIFLLVVVGGSLLLYAVRSGGIPRGQPFAPVSRDSLLLMNNLLFSAATAMVLIGTLYPLFSDAMNWGKVSVGAPYFGPFFIALMAPVVLLMVFGPFARWQREEGARFLPVITVGLVAAVLATVAAMILIDGVNVRAWAGAAGAAWVLAGTALFAWQRLRKSGPGKRFTAEMNGMMIAHFGVGLFVAGALLTEAINVERDVALKPGEYVEMAGYRFQFEGVGFRQGPNFNADRGTVLVFDGDRQIATLHPEKRAYMSGGQIMTEAAIRPGVIQDVYVALGEPLGDGQSWGLRLYVKPFIRWTWFGALLMAIGGIVVAFDRRFRRVPATRGAAEGAAEPKPDGTPAGVRA
ncbi:MAG: heme lyase CcmF/NrfE family subunit [Aquimonas sp.]|nr:heme lyase CcmF/NrfE family subunit [Aquimonas sp.]